MGFSDFFGLDSAAYYSEVYPLEKLRLQREHVVIHRKCIGAKASIAAGFGGAVHSGGLSLGLSGVGARRNSYNKQKLRVIERRLKERGWQIPDLTLGDYLITLGPRALADMVMPGAGDAVEHFGGQATDFITQHGTDTMSAAYQDPDTFAHAAKQGFKAQVSAVGDGISGNKPSLVPISSLADNTTEFYGDMAGQALASQAELSGTEAIVKAGTRFSLRSRSDPLIKSSTSNPPSWKTKPNRDVSRRDMQKHSATQPAPRSSMRSDPVLKEAPTKNVGVGTGMKSRIVLDTPSILDIQIFAGILGPSVVNSIAGVKALAVLSSALALWSIFVMDRENVFTIWLACIALPLLGLPGPRFLWFATFCLQFVCVVTKCMNLAETWRGLTNDRFDLKSLRRAARRWPLIVLTLSVSLHMCAKSELATVTIGMGAMCLTIFGIKSINLNTIRSDQLAFVLHVLQGCDCLALGLLPCIYFSAGETLLFFWGCLIADIIVCTLQVQTLPREKAVCFVMWESRRLLGMGGLQKLVILFCCGILAFLSVDAKISFGSMCMILVGIVWTSLLECRVYPY